MRLSARGDTVIEAGDHLACLPHQGVARAESIGLIRILNFKGLNIHARFAYVNGQYLSHHNAAVHIEDRGYQFGDGVYEVVLLIDGKMADCEGIEARSGLLMS